MLCGCRKYEETLHAAIRRLDRPEYEIVAILGESSVEEASFDPSTRLLTLPVADTYEALPQKIYAGLNWIYTNRPGIPGIFKTDDDMTFDMDTLVSTINANIERPYWGVAAGVCRAAPLTVQRINFQFSDKSLRPSHQTAAYCFGWGYWLSKAALPIVMAAAEDYRTSVLEDVCTGYVMNRAGIAPVRIRFPYKELSRTATNVLPDMK